MVQDEGAVSRSKRGKPSLASCTACDIERGAVVETAQQCAEAARYHKLAGCGCGCGVILQRLDIELSTVHVASEHAPSV